MSFLKRLVHKGSSNSVVDGDSTITRKHVDGNSKTTTSKPTTSSLLPHTRSQSGSSSAGGPSASSPPVVLRSSLINVPASLSITAKPAAIPAKLLPTLQSSALPPTALSPTSAQARAHSAVSTKAAATPSRGSTDVLHINAITASSTYTAPPGGQSSPVSVSSPSSTASSPSHAAHPTASSTTTNFTIPSHTTTASSGGPATSPTDAASTLLYPITFYPPGGLPSMSLDRYNDLLTEGAGWTLEDRLVYYVHLASRINGGQGEGWILEQIRPLCRKGVDINATSTVMPGITAITAACYHGYVAVVRYLLSQGADVNLCVEEGLSCVMLAVYIDSMEILKEVLTRRPSLEHVDAKQQNVLHIAVHRSLVWMVERMLPCRSIAALNQQDEEGRTPLILAVKQGSLEMVELLVGAGTDCTIREKNELSAFDLTLPLPDKRDTELMKRILSPIPQLTLPYLSSASFCTFWATDAVPTVQPTFYRCLTCDRSGLQGICDACHSHCHVGHNMVPADSSLRYYCGCGSGELRGELTMCASRPGQQYRTPQGEEIEWLMGKLSDAALRRVLMGLVHGLGLAGSVVSQQPAAKAERVGGRHPSHSASGALDGVREQITFHPAMQTIDADGIQVEWNESWLILFPLITVRILWRLQGQTARVSAHQYSIVSEYLTVCNAELSEQTAAAAAAEDPWDFGQMELAPSTGEVSYIVPYNAFSELITELSPLVEYNHQQAKRQLISHTLHYRCITVAILCITSSLTRLHVLMCMRALVTFLRFVAPLVRFMNSGNESVLGLRNTNATSAYLTPAIHSTASNTQSPLPHPHTSHTHEAEHIDPSSHSASSSASSSSSAPALPYPIRQSSSSSSSSSSSVHLSAVPSLPMSAAASAVAASSSAAVDDESIDLSAAHLESLGFDIIPSHNLDLPIDPTQVKTGGGAVVIRGHTIMDATPIAFKMFHHQEEMGYDNRLRKEFLDEATLLRRCAHSRIVQFMGLCVEPYGLVTELLDTSLYDVLYVERRMLSDLEVATIALEVCRGVAYLHGKNPAILHRDIKSHNILLNRHLTSVKICDLGIAKSKEQLRQQVESGEVDGLGSLAWMSPEGLDMLHSFDYGQLEKMDVYSVGCVLYEMLYRRIPWSTADAPNYPPPAAEIITRVDRGERPIVSAAELSGRSSMPAIWASLLDKCLAHSPQQRPSVTELVQTFSKIVKVCEKEQQAGRTAHQQSLAAISTPVHSSMPATSVVTPVQLQPSHPSAPHLAAVSSSSSSSSSLSNDISPMRAPVFHSDYSPPAMKLVPSLQPPPLPNGVLFASTTTSGRNGSSASTDGESARIHFSPPGTPSTASLDVPGTPNSVQRAQKSTTP